jgi:predicted transcriptional regulator
MQLDKLVRFHKALADLTRIRILSLLAERPLHGQALAGKLGVTPATITHHMTKLREVTLVYERREKNTIYFVLDEKVLRQKAASIVDVVYRSAGMEEKIMQEREKEKQTVVRNFFTAEGKLKQIPAQRKKKLYVFEHMIRGLEKGRKYTEKEINAFIEQYHEDYATIRREFIINHYMYREDSIYELNPEEMWARS